MPRPPPTSTLFPYTTLFRSLQNAFYQLFRAEDFEAALVATIIKGGDTDTNAAIAGALYGAWKGRETIPSGWIDRKSTRLNSSHSQISYAVFCLKKKKNTHSI